MFEDRLQESLINSGFQRMNSNAQGIYAYYRVLEHPAMKNDAMDPSGMDYGLTDRELQVISVMRIINGMELTYEQYVHILEQMKESFSRSFPLKINVLSLIATANPDAVRRLATDAQADNHWIVDLRANRLIIYETQDGEFKDLQKMVEQLLTEEQNQQSKQSQYNQGRDTQAGYHQGSSGQGDLNQRTQSYRIWNYRYLLTPVTMMIIALNLVAYIITHYTPLLGGPKVMLARGALSWYYVVEKNEYYRVLTSVFMHADWSHLVNNMIVLLFIGGNLERVIGKWRYLIIYFAGGILAGITSIGYNMWKEYAAVVAVSETTISIGASGAVFALVGAVLFIVLINKGRLREISIRQMVWFVFLSLYNGIVNSEIDQAAHVGGFLAGIILAVILYRRKTLHEN